MLLFLVLTTFLFAREKQILRNDSSEPFNPTNPSSREEIILHEVDFEGDIGGWSSGNSGGWELSDGDSHSPTHSYNSPDINDTGDTFNYIVENFGKGDGRIKFAALIHNKPSKVKVDYHGYEINKQERPHWIVFPWEEWDK